MNGRLRWARGAFVLDVDLALPEAGISCLFGPSGSGKTTLLRCVAGLEPAVRGRLEVAGEIWQDDAARIFLPPHRRRLGFVFQEAALFEHLSVRRNLMYGFERRPPAERRVGLADAVEWLGLAALLGRSTVDLSGGERQRVAIARALLASPRLLLMDEPLAALDAAAREEILQYLQTLHATLAVPILYVSHSAAEVMRLGDHLVLMNGGRVQAAGPVAEVAARLDLPAWAPENEIGAVVEAGVAAHDDAFDLTYLDFSGGRLSLPRLRAAVGSRVRVRILARDVSIALEPPRRSSILNIFPARVAEVGVPAPPVLRQPLVKLLAGDAWLLAQITRKSLAMLDLRPGMEVWAVVKGVAVLA